MAAVGGEDNGASDGGECHDLKSILAGDERDFLIHNNGDQVKIANLEGKTVGLYFSASWCPPCRGFTPKLIETYGELSSEGKDFEVVFVSGDRDEDSFNGYFSKMPWLAIPFSDSKARDRLHELFKVRVIPHLVILGARGEVLNEKGVPAVREYGSEGYPFTPEKINKLKEDEEAAKREQTLQTVLVSPSRDFLISNDGNKVKIANLEGKTIGLYFSASWCPPCRRFTPQLIETYGELSSEGKGLEVVFVSGDRDEDSFNGYFSKMPWLAIPFSDSKARDRLNKLFKVRGIPHLVILDARGEVVNEEGVEAVGDYGSGAYPFTLEKINKLKEDEEAAKREQTLQTVLVSPSRDYLISNNGNKVSVSELEGKIVCLYFTVNGFDPCDEFTVVLAKIYRTLKERGESFEVVLVSLDDEESSFKEGFASMPWLAIPFEDKSRERLVRYFELETAPPTLVVLGPDGKTMHTNIAELVEEHGEEAWEGFPFSQDKLDLLAEKAKAKLEAQTLESLLVSGEIDYVIGKDGVKVPVSELIGKNILLYFSAKWCGPCRAFLPKLIEEYNKIKEKDSAFEVVFISSDRDQNSFEDFFSGMPWLALPFGDERKKSLNRVFKIRGIPSLVAIGPTGKTVTTDARHLLMIHGNDAYPFTEERIKELVQNKEKTGEEQEETKEGYVCDGDVCRKA